jgi:hypothetical protein
MRLSKEAIKELRVTIISKPKEGMNQERLLRALNLILSEEDLRNYMIKIKNQTKKRKGRFERKSNPKI